MSSLELCAEKLLAHKAIQGSHYEHISHKLTELHRTERNASLTLKSLITDIERRRHDYEDIKLTGAELAQQLVQDRLKLKALMLAISESGKAKREIVYMLNECSEQWSTIPAELVQLLRILSERKHCISVAQEFTNILSSAQRVCSTMHDTIMVHMTVQENINKQSVYVSKATYVLIMQCKFINKSCHSSIQLAKRTLTCMLSMCYVQEHRTAQRLLHAEETHSAELIKQDGLRQRGDLARQYVAQLITRVEHIASKVANLENELRIKQAIRKELEMNKNVQLNTYNRVKELHNTEWEKCSCALNEAEQKNDNIIQEIGAIQSDLAANQLAIKEKNKLMYVLQWMTTLITELRLQVVSSRQKYAAEKEVMLMEENDWARKQEIALESVRIARFQSQCRETLQALIAEESLIRRAMCKEENELFQVCVNVITKEYNEIRHKIKEQELQRQQQQQEEEKQQERKWKVQRHNKTKEQRMSSKQNRTTAHAQLNETERYMYNSLSSGKPNSSNNSNNNVNKVNNNEYTSIMSDICTSPYDSSWMQCHNYVIHPQWPQLSNQVNKRSNIINNNSNKVESNCSSVKSLAIKRPRTVLNNGKDIKSYNNHNKNNNNNNNNNNNSKSVPSKVSSTYPHSVPSPSPLPRRPPHVPLSHQDSLSSSASAVVIPLQANAFTQPEWNYTLPTTKPKTLKKQRLQSPVSNNKTCQTVHDTTNNIQDNVEHNNNNNNNNNNGDFNRNDENHEEKGATGDALHVLSDVKRKKTTADLLTYTERKRVAKDDDDDNDNNHDVKVDQEEFSDSDTNSMASAVSVLSAALSTLKNVTTNTTTTTSGNSKNKIIYTLEHDNVRDYTEKKVNNIPTPITMTNNTNSKLNVKTNFHANKHVRFNERQREREGKRVNFNLSNGNSNNWEEGKQEQLRLKEVNNDQGHIQTTNDALELPPSPSPESSVLSDVTPALLIRNRPRIRENQQLTSLELPATLNEQRADKWQNLNTMNAYADAHTSSFTTDAATISTHNSHKKYESSDATTSAPATKRTIHLSRVNTVKPTKTKAINKITATATAAASHYKSGLNYSDDIFADIYS